MIGGHYALLMFIYLFSFFGSDISKMLQCIFVKSLKEGYVMLWSSLIMLFCLLSKVRRGDPQGAFYTKLLNLPPIFRFISKTIQDRVIVIGELLQ